MKAVTAIYSLW